MVNADTNDYADSPYGDLQQPKSQHSTFAYTIGSDKEGTTRLINKKNKTSGDDESDLAMAVDDILSCCDPESDQAKILKDMGSRIHETRTHIDEEKQELFSDEYYPKNLSWIEILSPTKMLEHMNKKKTGGSKYSERSSSSFSGSVNKKRDNTSRCRYGIAALVFFLAALMLTSIVVILVKVPTSSDNSDTSSAFLVSEESQASKDCALVAEEEYPNALSQCQCQGSIDTISEKARQKYSILLEAFGAEYLHERETIDSCSARNQALVWLAEDNGSTLSNVLIQRHTLVLFFIKLKGLEWTLDENSQQWLTSGHECTWFGVACNEDKQVTAIDLWDMNLDGPLPKEMMSLTSLERLALPENKITGHLPADAFIMMTKLTDLSLFMNSMSGSIDGQIFDSITQLRTFNMDSNALAGSIPTQVGKLSNLWEFKLARNYIQGTLPTEIGGLKLLKSLELEENNIVGNLPSEIGQLSQLEYLDLSWNSFTGVVPTEYQELRNLKNLFLKSNDFGGTLPTVLTAMSNLENVVLSLNAFTGNISFEMNSMPSLATLYLDGNKFGGPVPSELGSLSALRELRLDFNSFSGALPSELGNLTSLVTASLEGNSLTGSMPEEVCSLRSETGTLQLLSASCDSIFETQNRGQEVLGKTNEFVCRFPDCCTACELRR